MSPFLKMIALLSAGLLLVFGWHFATVFGYLGSAPQTQGEFFLRIGVILIGFIVVSGIGAAFVASRTERDFTPDEREEILLLKTERVGLTTLYIGLLVVGWLVFKPLDPMQVANALLAVVCISEFVKLVYALIMQNKRI